MVARAEEVGHYHAAVADLDSRKAQAHWGYKALQGLLWPRARTSIEPMARALEGGNAQALQPFIGQGQWQERARAIRGGVGTVHGRLENA